MSPLSLTPSQEQICSLAGEHLKSHCVDLGELTIDVGAENIVTVCKALRDQAGFSQLTDLCGMDYLSYGAEGGKAWDGERYAVIYHLISMEQNSRLRIRAQLPESNPVIDSVIEVWAGANWFEREAFDLYGIIFNGHPDLRRLLTDYGFIGHPFRKDFPLSGQVEMRYDEEQGRVIYQPVTIDPRILVPRTIRKDVFRTSTSDQSGAEESN